MGKEARHTVCHRNTVLNTYEGNTTPFPEICKDYAQDSSLFISPFLNLRRKLCTFFKRRYFQFLSICPSLATDITELILLMENMFQEADASQVCQSPVLDP